VEQLMELITPLLSSAVRYLQFAEKSDAFVPEVIGQIQERYRFWEAPKGPSDLNYEAGVKFNFGRFHNTTIKSFQIFTNGVMAQADAETSIIDAFLDDILQWIANVYDFHYGQIGPVEKIFVSVVEVRVKSDLSNIFDKLNSTMQNLSEMVAGYGITAESFTASGITFETDPLRSTPINAGRFVFERRGGKPYESNIFYSSAPVSTEQHLELLANLENSL
jgi:hypothetical protein